MPKIRCFAVVTILLLLDGTPYINAQLTGASSPVSHGSLLPASTCPAGTVNYITQTLPQQCFKTAWTEGTAPESSAVKLEQSTNHEPKSGTVGSNIGLEGHNAAPATGQTSESDTLPTTSVAEAANKPDGLSSLSSSLISSSTIALEAPSPTLEVGFDSDGDSPLDNTLFLSFEDWKKQNLVKAGQSADVIGHGRPQSGASEPRRRPGSINNALDSLGEDVEIELDFSGFVNPATTADALIQAKSESATGLQEPDDTANAGSQDPGIKGATQRSKDAGITCKERSNYASFDCAATVLKTNPKCKGATSVLVENKDSYMLNECSANNKFLIVELCDDILVDTVVLGNFEFFSSTFRSFKISVSDRYPVKMERWKELGIFVARNSREVQAFAIENPLIWARYLRIELLTHYGNEYYCPVSLLRVHGTTMIEEFRHQEESVLGEDDVEEQAAARDAMEQAAVTRDLKQGPILPFMEQSINDSQHSSSIRPDSEMELLDNPMPAAESKEALLGSSEASTSIFTPVDSSWCHPQVIFGSVNTHDLVCFPEEHHGSPPALPDMAMVGVEATITKEVTQETIAIVTSGNILNKTQLPPFSSFQSATASTISASSPSFSNSSAMRHDSSATPSTSSSSKIQSNQTASIHMKPSGSQTQPSPANPTTQESFFKSIHKRLQLLESNSTLSLQYIEEQSRILRDAFSKVEKRQLAKTTNFLETLNATVLSELRDFRHQYDQIWQSTVLELSSQREQSQREVVALSTRLSLLADEILFQKRMAILQFTLILLCLGLVIFSRNTSAAGMSYVELPPLAHNTVGQSSHFETPPTSPSSTGPTSRYRASRRRARRSRNRSEDSKGTTRSPSVGTGSPTIAHSPPTPTSEAELRSDAGDFAEQRSMSLPLSDGPEADVPLREANSGPATPSVLRATLDPMSYVTSDGEEDPTLRPFDGSSRRKSPLSEDLTSGEDPT
ncbi:MAG: hypothetical protein LQ347_001028 [Umbilicaria vellea]|nr:MAG: hypothetical protein LQ347_001028 [Umbilicaria vellea]